MKNTILKTAAAAAVAFSILSVSLYGSHFSTFAAVSAAGTVTPAAPASAVTATPADAAAVTGTPADAAAVTGTPADAAAVTGTPAAAPAETVPPAATAPPAVQKIITSFIPLTEAIAHPVYTNKPSIEELPASLPTSLSVNLDNMAEASDIPVTWSCTEDYAGTSNETYTFLPSWDQTLYALSPTLDPAKDIPAVVVSVNSMQAEVHFNNTDTALSTIGSIVNGKNIPALVYLCDSYDLKKTASKDAETLLSVASGQSVQITGAAEDQNKNIWYQVTANVSDTPYQGYIERKYLAYSDEDFINWEKVNINIYRRRSAVPSAEEIAAEISQFPVSYQAALQTLKNQHPNWTFVKVSTGRDFTTSVQKENQNTRSLIPSGVNAAWKTKPAAQNGWSYPSDGILAYYMDPRNFITDQHIFQFELLSYNGTYHTLDAVQLLLNGTFMAGAIPYDESSRSYAQAFSAIASRYDVSPFHLAARVRQEQGAGTSPLISGSYAGYEGLYNYFNIGAYGNSNQAVIEKGLTKAREKGWTTRYLSLDGGSDVISSDYIRKGQNNLYLQKFNVGPGAASPYDHQYMQNIMAPASEAVSVKKGYVTAGALDNRFVFSIPVYDNMPDTPCAPPTEQTEAVVDKPTLSLKVDATASLSVSVGGKAVDASSVTFTSSAPTVASVSGGTVTALSPGTAVITCQTAGAAAASCTVTVSQANPSYSIPVLSPVTYSPAQTLSAILLPPGWSWDNPAFVPVVTNAGYPATFTPADTIKYNTVKITVSLSVLKGTPAYTLPSGLATAVGNTLGSFKLPLGFSWDTPSTVLAKEGTYSYKASYNPDAANYNTVTGIDIPITVNAKTAVCTNHSFGEWEHSLLPSCAAPGKDTRSCHLCGYMESLEVAALVHSYSSVVTKEATEAEDGLRTYTCSLCKTSYTEPITKLPSSHSHNYSAAVTAEATCEQNGVRTYTCSCNDTYTEAIPASGHIYTNAVTKEPSESAAGIRTYTCSKCGSAYTEEIPVLGHDMKDGKCTRCGYTEQKQESPAPAAPSTGTSAPSVSESPTTPPAAPPAPAAPTPEAPAVTAPSTETAAPTVDSSKTEAKPTNKPASSSGTASKDKIPEKSGVTINMDANTMLFKETLASIKGEDINVVLNMKQGASWTINGKNITDIDADGVDMDVEIGTASIPSVFADKALKAAKKAGMEDESAVIGLSLAHNGTFAFDPEFRLIADPEYVGMTANLFYCNTEAETLEFVEAVTIGDDGSIIFTFKHASDYVIIISESTMADEELMATAADTAAAEEETPKDTTVSPETAVPDNKEHLISPAVIAIIIVIIILAAVIGITVYFLLNKKDDEPDPDSDTDPEEVESTAEEFEESEYEESEYEESDYEDSDIDTEIVIDENEENDFIDDYYEPAVQKKTGKVTSIKKQMEHSVVKNSGADSLHEDEFDGFE